MQLRTMLLETNRMMSHMICVGAQLSDVGAVNSILWLMEERERLVRVVSHHSGSRLHPHVIVE